MRYAYFKWSRNNISFFFSILWLAFVVSSKALGLWSCHSIHFRQRSVGHINLVECKQNSDVLWKYLSTKTLFFYSFLVLKSWSFVLVFSTHSIVQLNFYRKQMFQFPFMSSIWYFQQRNHRILLYFKVLCSHSISEAGLHKSIFLSFHVLHWSIVSINLWYK